MQTKTLFSQHYLEHRLPDHPEWDEDPRAVFAAVRTLWQRAREHGESWNESQTEQEFIQPVLHLLGWATIVQPQAHHAGRLRRPDYALFSDEAAKLRAMPLQGDDDAFYGRASAIAEAKYWGRPLSQKDEAGQERWDAQTNPSHQMVSYLVGTGAPWGFLTNGVIWRLYSREVSSTASEFYEVDLRAIFGALPPEGAPSGEQLDAFRRWWLFFRQASFVPDARGRSFVARVHEGSATYARRISDKLKELVYEEVMPEIAGGFVAHRYHQLGVREETEDSLREIYRASLSLLYKLLFLLYGEARALLPVEHPGYRDQSLTKLARWAAERVDEGLPLSDATYATPKYDALLGLFDRIDRGDPALGIPRYDGGLFDPSSPENAFLKAHTLSDRAVARAVDILVRDAGEPVDYAYIGVQNLGSIYEGLLENRLRVIDAARGEVTLLGDKGERKATGSYYTPDYIVEYIVQQTLDPILEARDAAFCAAMDRCAEVRRKLKRTSHPGTTRLLRGQLDEAERDAREAFLGIKTLDPAMGSGHFLVNAVDHLTDAIILRMQVYHDAHPDVPWDWNPIQQLIERVRAAILEEMERQGIDVDPARLDDTALLTRLVMKRCIYGVDLNRMAVELAKVSLWLHTFTVGAPLSFLDHHLRWGNSLIGADVRTVEQEIQSTEAGQFSLWQGPFSGLLELTGLMVEVVERADATLADVEQSAEDFKTFQEMLTPYKQVLDLWVSQYFGNEEARDFLMLYGEKVLPALRGEEEVAARYQETVERARALYEEKRFFHWDLEFPEVFVDLRARDWAENPGFDAVIGNPPYANAWSMTDLNAAHRKAIETINGESDLLSGHWDLYAAFIIRALTIAKRKGFHSFIIPDAFAREKYAKSLRRHVLQSNKLLSLMHFEGINVFDEVSRHCVIYVIRKAAPSDDSVTEILVPLDAGKLKTQKIGKIKQKKWLKSTDNQIRVRLADSRISKLIEKIEIDNIKVGQFCYVMVGATVHSKDKTSFTKDTIVTDKPVGNAKRFFDGKNISRYEIRWDGRYLDYRQDEIYGPRVPELFESPKVVIRDVTGADEQLIVSFDEAGLYCDHLVTCVTYYENVENTGAQVKYEGFERLQPPYPDLLYLTGILASKLLTWYFREVFATGTLQGSYSHTYPQQVRAFPIRKIAFTTSPEERERLAAEGRDLAERALHTFPTAPQKDTHYAARNTEYPTFLASPLGLWLDARLTAEPEQADVIHDLLAHLAEQMIAMHKEKQALIKKFRLDLEGVTDPDTFARLEKGKQGRSLWKSAACRPFVEEESYTTHHLDESLAWNEACFKAFVKMLAGRVDNLSGMVNVYGRYHPEVRALVQRIAATDRLIDLIVYRLYGLTAEEVAVVEGASTD